MSRNDHGCGMGAGGSKMCVEMIHFGPNKVVFFSFLEVSPMEIIN